jgi:hypothetical protein
MIPFLILLVHVLVSPFKTQARLEAEIGPCHVAQRGTRKGCVPSGLRVVSPQATAARQVSIAAARKRRCVDAEVR